MSALLIVIINIILNVMLLLHNSFCQKSTGEVKKAKKLYNSYILKVLSLIRMDLFF